MIKKVYLILLVFIFFVKILNAQNLILNPSFSITNIKIDQQKPCKISNELLSEVKNWYVPSYIYNLNKKSPYQFVHYYTSRDKDLIPKDRRTQCIVYGEQLFENNLGFMYINIMRIYSLSVIQQKFIKPLQKGNYCFKFKYKFERYSSSYNRPVSLDFAFSPTNLSEYYKHTLLVPSKLIKINFKDTINDIDANEPWIQKCFLLNLEGNEKYLSIGSLSNLVKQPHGTFLIDDLELYFIGDSIKCECEKQNIDLSIIYKKEFPLDSVIKTDTLVMFVPSLNVGSGIISPDAKNYLNNIISFMQRNPAVKIKFIEYNNWNTLVAPPSQYVYFYRYLGFYGINRNRMSIEQRICGDVESISCGKYSEFIKIGFILYID